MIVRFLDPAKDSLNGIVQFYRRLDKTKTGRKVRAAIIKRAMKLKEGPFIGQVEEQLASRGEGHRYLVEGNFKIIYRVIDQIVYITDIFNTRQDPGKMKP